MTFRIGNKRAAAVCAALVALITALQGGAVPLPPELVPWAPWLALGLMVVVAVLRPVETGPKKPARRG